MTAQDVRPSTLELLADLLRRPGQALESPDRSTGTGARLFAAFWLATALFGAAAGCFQGGWQILLAGLKAPLIILVSVALCLPSLWVFASLGGAELEARTLRRAIVGFLALVGLLLLAWLPIIWLFSVSSRSLVFVILLHVLVWTVTIAFGRRFLQTVLGAAGVRSLGPWTMLLILVSFQVATLFGPLLWRRDGDGLVRFEKGFFTERFTEAWREEPFPKSSAR